MEEQCVRKTFKHKPLPTPEQERTSQDCSGVLPDGSRCTQRVAKSRSVRIPVGPSCGLVMGRDESAVLHLRRAGQARQAPTWVDAPSVA
jgi:hypothetical protein